MLVPAVRHQGKRDMDEGLEPFDPAAPNTPRFGNEIGDDNHAPGLPERRWQDMVA
jgi:hypothetical protein